MNSYLMKRISPSTLICNLLITPSREENNNLFFEISDDVARGEFKSEAGADSVEYLSQTKYACNGAVHFSSKQEEQGQNRQSLEFLSTHPGPENYIEEINEQEEDIGCNTSLSNDSRYTSLKTSLP
jgi:predicted Zn-dependent protease